MCSTQGPNEGGAILRAPSHYGVDESLRRMAVWGAENSQQCYKYFLQIAHLPPKDLRLEHGDAKLASCPGRHLTSLRPWQYLIETLSSNIQYVMGNARIASLFAKVTGNAQCS